MRPSAWTVVAQVAAEDALEAEYYDPPRTAFRAA